MSSKSDTNLKPFCIKARCTMNVKPNVATLLEVIFTATATTATTITITAAVTISTTTAAKKKQQKIINQKKGMASESDRRSLLVKTIASTAGSGEIVLISDTARQSGFGLLRVFAQAFLQNQPRWSRVVLVCTESVPQMWLDCAEDATVLPIAIDAFSDPFITGVSKQSVPVSGSNMNVIKCPPNAQSIADAAKSLESDQRFTFIFDSISPLLAHSISDTMQLLSALKEAGHSVVARFHSDILNTSGTSYSVINPLLSTLTAAASTFIRVRRLPLIVNDKPQTSLSATDNIDDVDADFSGIEFLGIDDNSMDSVLYDMESSMKFGKTQREIAIASFNASSPWNSLKVSPGTARFSLAPSIPVVTQAKDSPKAAATATATAATTQKSQANLAALSAPAPNQPSAEKKSTEDKNDPAANLSFNLRLTDEQRRAKDNVVLPYMIQESNTAPMPDGGAEIIYQADEADDLDEEDPDDDLDI
ncbi:hypothetical protein GQ42DRAFT_19027 [Ramicandelaber brevisporus]|nr:hypothetical protein GQ42DRAFT_19027 [Ramicandelaber brevisporus]